MNVFVLCTGRCGSMTFARACQKMTNFTAAHESRRKYRRETRGADSRRLAAYPDNHIEIDNRLSWLLGTLEREYGDEAFYVHLIRDRDEVARSLVARWDNRTTNIISAYAWGVLGHSFDQVRKMPDVQRLEIARDFWNTVNDNIRLFLNGKRHQMTMSLQDIEGPFAEFWGRIGAEGDLAGVLGEWATPYNATAGPGARVSREQIGDSGGSEPVAPADTAPGPGLVVVSRSSSATGSAEGAEPHASTRRALDGALDDFRQVDLSDLLEHSLANSWSLDDEVLRYLVTLVRRLRPRHILELGAGVSTRLLLRAADRLDEPCSISSFDHDPEFLDHASAQLRSESRGRLSLQFAPLVSRRYGERYLPVYHVKREDFANAQPIDLCLVDGPPISLGGREGILYQVMEYCRPGTCILLDDADRPGERQALESWEAVFGPAIEIRRLDGFSKGLASVIVREVVNPNDLWNHMLATAASELNSCIPRNARVLVVDDYQWADRFDSLVNFEVERDPAMPPGSAAHARELLSKKAETGIDFAILCRPSFWWSEEFGDIDDVLGGDARRILSTSRAMAYEFRRGIDGGAAEDLRP